MSRTPPLPRIGVGVDVSVQLIGERPSLGPRRAEAQRVLTAALGAPVFLGAATPEGLGMLGREEGVLAIANALIVDAAAVT